MNGGPQLGVQDWIVRNIWNAAGLSGFLAVFLLLVLLGLIPTPAITGNQATLKVVLTQQQEMAATVKAIADANAAFAIAYGKEVDVESRERRTMVNILRMTCLHIASGQPEKDDCMRAGQDP